MNFFTPYVHIHNQQKDQSRQQGRTRSRGQTPPWSSEVSRLLSAAVVNQRFCRLLLTEPRSALELGFNGESFAFSAQEESLILSIQATTLRHFTVQLLALYENGAVPMERVESYRTPTIQIPSLASSSI